MYNITESEENMDIIKENMKKHFDKFLNKTENIDLLQLFSSKELRTELIECFMNSVIQSEFEMFLGYKKYQRTSLEKENYRNGSHKKKFNTKDGKINLTIPHDRNTEFYPSSVPKHKRRSQEIASAVIELFALGNSNKEVVRFCDRVFGTSYSRQTISNIVEVLDEVVEEFNTRRINDKYFTLFLDATYIPIRFNHTYDKQAIHLIVGITPDGYQEILGYKIGFSENTVMWEELLQDLKSRGLKEVTLFCMDGAPGVPNLVKGYFPKSKIQVCQFHMLQNLSKKLRKKDKAEIMGLVKQLYHLSDMNLILHEQKRIINLFPEYKRVLKFHFEKEYQYTYIDFPGCVHKLIRTTNRIERINGIIKTGINHKRTFPNESSLERFLVSVILDINTKSTRKVNGMQEYLENK